MYMKKALLILFVLVIILLIPWNIMYATDGGTVVYSAPLYTITKRHAMWWEGEIFGYHIGTEIEILSFEVYNDVGFIPDTAFETKKIPIPGEEA